MDMMHIPRANIKIHPDNGGDPLLYGYVYLGIPIGSDEYKKLHLRKLIDEYIDDCKCDTNVKSPQEKWVYLYWVIRQKFPFWLRHMSPTITSDFARDIDQHLRVKLNNVIGEAISDDTWNQARLPVKSHGFSSFSPRSSPRIVSASSNNTLLHMDPLSTKRVSSATTALSLVRGSSPCRRMTSPSSQLRLSANAAVCDWACRSTNCPLLAAAGDTRSLTGPTLATSGPVRSSNTYAQTGTTLSKLRSKRSWRTLRACESTTGNSQSSESQTTMMGNDLTSSFRQWAKTAGTSWSTSPSAIQRARRM